MTVNIPFGNNKSGIMQSAAELERRIEAKLTRGERRRSTQQTAKMERERDDEEKFSNILHCCKRILSTAINECDEFFDLLDPLISDSQCQLHSVLILDILHKCYNNNESNFYGINKLGERDQKILSHAVLFSLSKIECRDELGFVIHQVSLEHYYGAILSSRNRERNCLEQARKTFNSYSVDLIKSVASEKIKTIFNECAVLSSSSSLVSLPCYAGFSAVINYIEARKLPIILSLVSVNALITDGATEYNINRNSVRFYEFREKEKKFFRKKKLSDREKEIPTIVFSFYSVTTNSTEELEVDHDVRDLILIAAAGHVQLPKNSNLPIGYEDGGEYARKLYEKDVEFFIKYKKHYELAKERNLIDAQYSNIIRSSVEQGCDYSTFIVERSNEKITLRLDHVCVSNFSRECQRLENSDFNTKLGQHEVFEFSKKKETLEISRRFTVPQIA